MSKTKIDTMKLPILKNELDKLGLPRKGNKRELILRLKEKLASSFIISDASYCDTLHDNIPVASQSNDISLSNQLQNTSPVNNVPKLNKQHKKPNSINILSSLQQKIKKLEQTISFLYKNNKKIIQINKKLNEHIEFSADTNRTKDKNRNENGNIIANKIINCSKPRANNINPNFKQAPVNNISNKKHNMHKPHPTVKTKNSKGNILILADSHGRNVASLFNKLLLHKNYSITSFFKPNAQFHNVTENIAELTKDFGANDYVIVMAGSNNVLNNSPVTITSVISTLKCVKHTNTVLIGAPFWQNKTMYNNNIYLLNSLLYDTSKSFPNVDFFEPNIIINNSHMTAHGLHLNKRGKYKLFNRIAQYICKTDSNFPIFESTTNEERFFAPSGFSSSPINTNGGDANAQEYSTIEDSIGVNKSSLINSSSNNDHSSFL